MRAAGFTHQRDIVKVPFIDILRYEAGFYDAVDQIVSSRNNHRQRSSQFMRNGRDKVHLELG